MLIVGLLVLALAFAACSGNESAPAQTPTPAPQQDQATTTPDADEPDLGDDYIYFYGLHLPVDADDLIVWMPYEDFAMALIESFNERFPNVNVIWEEVGHSDSRDRMILDGPAGLGADTFNFPHDQIAFAILDGQIQPVPEALEAKWQRELIETAIGTVTHNGAVHAAPFQIENIALFYNRDLWGDVGPTTWEEILEFAETYNDPANHDWAMAWDVNTGFFNVFWLTAGGMQLFGPNNDDYTQIGFDTPEAARGLAWFQQMRALFDMPSADVEFATAEERFRTGQIPLTITGPWAIHDSLENGVNLGITSIPTIEGIQPYAFSGVMVSAVSTWSTNPWAYAFVDHLVSEAGAAVLYEHRNMMTTRRDISAIPGLSDDPYLSGIARQSPFTVPMPSIAEVQFMWAPLDELFRFSWDGDLSIEEVQEHAMNTYRNSLIIAGRDIDF